MKKLILTLALLAGATAAFGQGKVALVGDTLSHVVAVPPLPSDVVLIAGLWGGMTQGSMILQTSVLLTNAVEAGWISQTRVVLTGIPGIASGTPIGAATPWFQVHVWDSAFGTDAAGWAAALAAVGYAYASRGAGDGTPFQMNPGNSIAYVLTAPPSVNSTWTEGNIIVTVWPEPSTLTLAGLGAAAVLVSRRRK